MASVQNYRFLRSRFAHYNYCLIALPIPKRKLGKADRETSAEISLSGLSFHAFVAGFCFWLFLL